MSLTDAAVCYLRRENNETKYLILSAGAKYAEVNVQRKLWNAQSLDNDCENRPRCSETRIWLVLTHRIFGSPFRTSPEIGQLTLPIEVFRDLLSHSRQMPRPPLPHTHTHFRVHFSLYRVIQEERSIFWEVISVIVREKFIWTRVEFWMVTEIELFGSTNKKRCDLQWRKRNYLLLIQI